MKSIIILSLFVCLCAAFTSCVKTDVSPVSTNQPPVVNSGDPAKTNTSPVTNTVPVIGNVSTVITLAGNWSLINDSTSATGVGPSYNVKSGNYIGQPADYFNFTNDGRVYIKEGASIDTANYTITAGNKIQMNYLYYAGAYVTNYGAIVAAFDQLNLSVHTVTLSSATVIPGGSVSRVINLKR